MPAKVLMRSADPVGLDVPGDGWLVSGFSKTGVAHFVVEKNGLLETKCSFVWWKSDYLSRRAMTSADRKCKNCARREANDVSR